MNKNDLPPWSQGKLAHVIYALIVAMIGMSIGGMTGWFGLIVTLALLGLAGWIVYRRFQLNKTILDPWP